MSHMGDRVLMVKTNYQSSMPNVDSAIDKWVQARLSETVSGKQDNVLL